MTARSVFSQPPQGDGGGAKDPVWVSARIVRALADGGWVTTSTLYRACHNNVGRDLLHEALKGLLRNRTISMQVIQKSKGSKARTQFKLTAPPTVSATQSATSEQ